MKNVLLITVSLSFGIYCSGSLDDTEASTITSVSVSNIKVNDAAGTELGWLVGSVTSNVQILNSNGYLFSIAELDGTLTDSTGIYYANVSCAGTAYTTVVYSKSVFQRSDDSTILTLKNTTKLSGQAYQSIYNGSGNCTASAGTADLYELESKTRTDLGIPDTITGPVSLIPQQ